MQLKELFLFSLQHLSFVKSLWKEMWGHYCRLEFFLICYKMGKRSDVTNA